MINKTSKLATIALVALTAFGCAGNRSHTNKTDLYPDARKLHCPGVTTGYDPIVGINRATVNGVELKRVYPAQEMSDGERILTDFYNGDNARAREAMDYIRSNNLQCPSVELAPRDN